MSGKNASGWLLSKNQFCQKKEISPIVKFSKLAKVISVTSGKGGVGKTSVTLKMGKVLADWGHKVLIIDCDYNLSNTLIKLGLPFSNDFSSLMKSDKVLDECLYKNGNFHLLSGCNGDLDLLDNKIELDKVILNIINQCERDYDFIFLDCPAGLAKQVMILNTYSDSRIFVVTPDKSSVTDSYSLMKILSKKYGIKENHLLLNKISSKGQYLKLIKSLSETVESFLNCRLHIMGGIYQDVTKADSFDHNLLFDPHSAIHKNFIKVIKKFSENSLGLSSNSFLLDGKSYGRVDDCEQEVRSTIS